MKNVLAVLAIMCSTLAIANPIPLCPPGFPCPKEPPQCYLIPPVCSGIHNDMFWLVNYRFGE
jgi:hypothetical protein